MYLCMLVLICVCTDIVLYGCTRLEALIEADVFLFLFNHHHEDIVDAGIRHEN